MWGRMHQLKLSFHSQEALHVYLVQSEQTFVWPSEAESCCICVKSHTLAGHVLTLQTAPIL